MSEPIKIAPVIAKNALIASGEYVAIPANQKLPGPKIPEPECIRVSEDAAKEIVPAIIGDLSKIEQIQGYYHFDKNSIVQHFNDILRDRTVHCYESPALFRTFKQAAGADLELSNEEVSYLIAAIELDLANKIIRYAEKIITDTSESVDVNAVIDSVFSSDVPVFLDELAVAQKIIENLIGSMERYKAALIERERSYWNFVSAENLLGLSSVVSYNGDAFSSAEWQATHEILQDLYSIRSGISRMVYYVENGTMNLSNEDVRAFISSPFAEVVSLNEYFNGKGTSAAGCNECEKHRRYILKLIEYLYNKGASRSASAFAREYEEAFGPDHALDQIMPGRVYDLVDNEFTMFANAVASMDSLLALAVGGAVGKLASTSLKTTIAVEKFARIAPYVKVITPAAPLFKVTAGSGKLAKVSKVAANIGHELIKMNIYMNIGRQIGGETGMKIGSMFYLFNAGLYSAYSTGVGLLMMNEVASGVPGPLTKVIYETGGNVGRVSEILSAGGRVKSISSFRPADTVSYSNLNRMFGSFYDHIERMGMEAVRVEQRIFSMVGRIKKYVVQQGLGENALADIERVAVNNERALVPKALGELFEDLQSQVRARTTKGGTAPVYYSPFSTSNIRGKARSGGGANGKGFKDPNIQPKSNGVVVANTDTSIELVLKDPPAATSEQVIRDVTKGRLIVNNGALKELERIYTDNPAKRGNLLRALRDISEGSNVKILGGKNQYGRAGWEFVKNNNPIYSSKVARPYRVLAQRNDKGIMEVITVKHRGNFKGEGWSER